MRKVDGLFLSPKSKKEVNHNDKTELTAEISVLEKAVKSYEKHEKDADRFIALIDKYENFDKLTIAMLNEFIEKILVHAHRFFIYIKGCKNVLLKGFTAVDGPSWHVVPAACDHIVIDDMYLQHGFGESEISWTTTGKANIILDNLIEMGKIKPFALVMSDGMVQEKVGSEERLNHVLLERMLVEEIFPMHRR